MISGGCGILSRGLASRLQCTLEVDQGLTALTAARGNHLTDQQGVASGLVLCSRGADQTLQALIKHRSAMG